MGCRAQTALLRCHHLREHPEACWAHRALRADGGLLGIWAKWLEGTEARGSHWEGAAPPDALVPWSQVAGCAPVIGIWSQVHGEAGAQKDGGLGAALETGFQAGLGLRARELRARGGTSLPGGRASRELLRRRPVQTCHLPSLLRSGPHETTRSPSRVGGGVWGLGHPQAFPPAQTPGCGRLHCRRRNCPGFCPSPALCPCPACPPSTNARGPLLRAHCLPAPPCPARALPCLWPSGDSTIPSPLAGVRPAPGPGSPQLGADSDGRSSHKRAPFRLVPGFSL